MSKILQIIFVFDNQIHRFTGEAAQEVDNQIVADATLRYTHFGNNEPIDPDTFDTWPNDETGWANLREAIANEPRYTKPSGKQEETNEMS
jgi:hypothetical protein